MTGIERLRALANGDASHETGNGWFLTAETLESIAGQIERETLPRPLFEDGTPVKRGDIVLVDGEEAQVNGFYVNYNGSFGLDTYVLESGMTIGNGYGSGERVKRPSADTWERVEADAAKSVCGYFGKEGESCRTTETECPARNSDSCSKFKAKDIVLRCKKLAGVD